MSKKYVGAHDMPNKKVSNLTFFSDKIVSNGGHDA